LRNAGCKLAPQKGVHADPTWTRRPSDCNADHVGPATGGGGAGGARQGAAGQSARYLGAQVFKQAPAVERAARRASRRGCVLSFFGRTRCAVTTATGETHARIRADVERFADAPGRCEVRMGVTVEASASKVAGE